MPSALAFLGGGLLEGVGKGLVLSGKEKRERQLADLDHKNRLERDEKKVEGKAKYERALAGIDHKRALELKLAPGAPMLPSGYQRTENGLEFIPGGPADPAQVDRLAEAGRAPDGGATPAQAANNAEIDQARATLDRMGLDKAEITRRTQKATNTGRENPEYDPGLERLVRAATQRKIGNDPYYNLFHRRYLGPPPEFSEPAGPKDLPPGVSAEEPSAIDSIRDFFTGDDANANQPAPQTGLQQAAPTRPQALDRFPGRAPLSESQPQAADGAVDIAAMSLSEIDDLVNAKGDSLSPADLRAIEARLAELGK